jgi:hypothetical protein
MVVGSKKCGGRTRALARALPRGNLQLAIRMLIGRMPEKWRRPALRRFAESVDWIARNFKQRKRFRFRSVLIPLETSRIGLICHLSPQVLPELQAKIMVCPSHKFHALLSPESMPKYPLVGIVNNKSRDRLHPFDG